MLGLRRFLDLKRRSDKENAKGSGFFYECSSADCFATAAAGGCSGVTSRSKTRAVRAIPLPPWAVQR